MKDAFDAFIIKLISVQDWLSTQGKKKKGKWKGNKIYNQLNSLYDHLNIYYLVL